MNNYYYFGLADDRVRAYPILNSQLLSMSYSEEEHGEHPVFNDFSKKIVGSLLFGRPIIIDERSLIQQPNFLASLVQNNDRINYIASMLKSGYIKLLSNNEKFSEIPERLKDTTRTMKELKKWLDSSEGAPVKKGLKEFDKVLTKDMCIPFPKQKKGNQTYERYIHKKIVENKINEYQKIYGSFTAGFGYKNIFINNEWEEFTKTYTEKVNNGVTFRTAWEDSLIKIFKYPYDDFESPRKDIRIQILMNFVNEARHKAYPIAMGLENKDINIGVVTHETGIFSEINPCDTANFYRNIHKKSQIFDFFYSLNGVLENIEYISELLVDTRSDLYESKNNFLEAIQNHSTKEHLLKVTKIYEDTLFKEISKNSKTKKYHLNKALRFSISTIINIGIGLGYLVTTQLAAPITTVDTNLEISGVVLQSLLSSGLDFVCQGKFQKKIKNPSDKDFYERKLYKNSVYMYEDILPNHINKLKDSIDV